MILSYLKSWKMWGVAIIIGVVAFFIYDYRSTLQELSTVQSQYESLSGQVEQVEQRIELERKRRESLRETTTAINNNYLSVVRELQQMRENREVIKEKPSLAEDKIDESFNEFMKEVSCITGEGTQCPNTSK